MSQKRKASTNDGNATKKKKETKASDTKTDCGDDDSGHEADDEEEGDSAKIWAAAKIWAVAKTEAEDKVMQEAFDTMTIAQKSNGSVAHSIGFEPSVYSGSNTYTQVNIPRYQQTLSSGPTNGVVRPLQASTALYSVNGPAPSDITGGPGAYQRLQRPCTVPTARHQATPTGGAINIFPGYEILI